MELSGGVRLESTRWPGADGRARHVLEGRERRPRSRRGVVLARPHERAAASGWTTTRREDVIVIADRAAIDVKANENGAGAMTLASAIAGVPARRGDASASIACAKITRDGQIVEADLAVAHLSADEERLELLELRNNSRITATSGRRRAACRPCRAATSICGTAPDGQTLQHANSTAMPSSSSPGSGGSPVGRSRRARWTSASVLTAPRRPR